MSELRLMPPTPESRAIPPVKSDVELGNGAGFLLLSTGSDRRQSLWDCIDSVRRHYPRAPIHVISDVPVQGDNITAEWIDAFTGTSSRFYKTQMHRLTPFQISVFIDDDTVIHRPFGQAVDWLNDADVAMASDYPRVPLGTRQFKLPHEAEIQSLSKGREDWAYHNSGVIIFRASPSTHRLFDAWHDEWLRTQQADQPPLLRARTKTGIPVHTLPKYMNYFPHLDGIGSAIGTWEGAQILHWTRFKNSTPSKYFDAMELPRGAPSATYKAFANAVDKGLCDQAQYVEIGRAIKAIAPARVLVFGTGADSLLWKLLNTGGQTRFVEDSPYWTNEARKSGCDVMTFNYPTRRGVSAARPQRDALAAAIGSEEWDLILIDGPQGAQASSPGRELPVMFAAATRSRPTVILHDFERPWERTIASRHLGPPDYILPGNSSRGSLAVWRQAA